MQANLPESVRRQSARFDEHKAQVEKSLLERNGEPPSKPNGEDKTPPQDPPTQELNSPDGGAGPEAPSSDSQDTDLKQEMAKISHRLKTLEGMWRSEKTKRETAEAEVAELKEQLDAKAPPVTAEPEIKLEDFFTEEDIEAYGRDYLLKQMKAQSKLVDLKPLEDRLNKLHKEIEPLKKAAESSQQSAEELREEKFWEDLSREVPDWADIDQDQEFAAYLQQVHPESGLPRQTFFSDAYDKRDAKRVIAVMQGYKASKAAVQKPNPDMHVHPESSGGSDLPPQDKPIFTTKEYLDFMKEYRKGRYNARPEWAKARLHELEAAYREGRVR